MALEDKWMEHFNSLAKKDISEHEKGSWTREGYSQLLRVTLSLVDKLPLKKGSMVLDVGCGVGRYCHEMKKRGFSVVGVDASHSLIEEAKKLFSDVDNIDFKVLSGYSLSFDNFSFDLVLSIGVLQCIENYELFLSELCRVSSDYVILSTLESYKQMDHEAQLTELIKDDCCQTREYYPPHLVEIFKKHGFEC